MNALVSIDVATLTPATVFAPGGVEAIVSKIEAEVSAEVFTLETAEGRERIKSVAYRVARSKTALDDMGKELVAGIKAQAATIDAERRTIRERLDALKESVRGPLTAWEDAEVKRIDGHEQAIVFFAETRVFRGSTDELRGRIATIRDIIEGRDWQEFHDRAHEAATDAVTLLSVTLAAAEQAERDAAELAELRRMKAEREAADAAAAVAAQEVERARLAEAAKAERAAQEAAQAAERERIRAEQQAERDRQNAERAEQEKIAAAARAVEQERERAARVKADEERAAAKLAANKRHRAKVHADVAVAINQALNGAQYSPERLVEAIAAGIIPHVSITY